MPMAISPAANKFLNEGITISAKSGSALDPNSGPTVSPAIKISSRQRSYTIKARAYHGCENLVSHGRRPPRPVTEWSNHEAGRRACAGCGDELGISTIKQSPFE